MSERSENQSETGKSEPLAPAFLQLPLEERPWTGYKGQFRFFPERHVDGLPWLKGDEVETVQRTTWNGFVRVLEGEGYQVLSQLAERLRGRASQAAEERKRAASTWRDRKERLREARHLERLLGPDTSALDLAQAPEAEGWTRRFGKVLRSLDSDPQDDVSRFGIAVPPDKLLRDILDEATSDLHDSKARYMSAENRFVLLAFRRDVAAEVLRQFEVYGVTWNWDYAAVQEVIEDASNETGSRATSRFAPHYDWICQTYAAVQPTAVSNSAARAEVVELFRAEFEDAHIRQWGDYRDPSESTIRRALGEID